MSDELKPCPFCGQLPEVEPWHGSGQDSTRIGCNSCSCHVNPGYVAPSRNSARKHWNTRPIEDALRAEVDELSLGVMTASERAGKYHSEIVALKAELAKYTKQEDALRAEVEMRGDQVSALMGQVAQYMAEAQTLRAENARLQAEIAEWEQKAANWMSSPEARQQLEGYRELSMNALRATERAEKAEAEVTRLREALAKRDEPLTDEQAERAFAIAKENGVGECDTLAHGVQGIDAAIRRVRGES